MELASVGVIRHIVVYHPDRLMRQPWDLEELLSIADENGIILHGKSGNRDLSDPDDTSRRTQEAMVDRARDGKPHTGARRFGYTPDGMNLFEDEAATVRWICESFLDGMTPHAIAVDLNRRGVPTSQGRRWRLLTVRKPSKLRT
jgi:DNA invertase Pin-like site-specific DNA recombinase